MTTGQAIWRQIRYRWGFYLLGLVASIIFEGAPLPIGLLIRAFFDGITNQASAGLNLWTVVALLLATEGGRIAGLLTGGFLWSTTQQTVHALMRKNLLVWLVQGPGARCPTHPARRSVASAMMWKNSMRRPKSGLISSVG